MVPWCSRVPAYALPIQTLAPGFVSTTVIKYLDKSRVEKGGGVYLAYNVRFQSIEQGSDSNQSLNKLVACSQGQSVCACRLRVWAQLYFSNLVKSKRNLGQRANSGAF